MGEAGRFEPLADGSDLKRALDEVRKHIDDPSRGLPEDVFLFLSEISPLPNVDLLVRDKEGRILLAWRNDPWWGAGWHVPGGIIRVKETFEERIQKTAKAELGTAVVSTKEPVEIHQIINRDLRTRGHHITIVFECSVPDDYQIDNGDLTEHDTGFLAWHDHFPERMLRCHLFYRKYFQKS